MLGVFREVEETSSTIITVSDLHYGFDFEVRSSTARSGNTQPHSRYSLLTANYMQNHHNLRLSIFSLNKYVSPYHTYI